MTDTVPDEAREAFEAHDSVTATAEGFAVESTVFDGFLTASEGPDWKHTYTVTVYVPSLGEATADEVGAAVEENWQDTLTRRLEDAPQATRSSVEIHDFEVEDLGGELQITYSFEWGEPRRATEIGKTFVEYVEGTYVEGIVPGYEYEPPVSDLLSSASQSEDDAKRGGTPL
jgi:hypothetical protein